MGVSTIDNQTNKYFYTPGISKFTTVGPLTIDSLEIIKYSDTLFAVKPFIKNESADQTVNTITIKIICDDPWVTKFSPQSGIRSCPNLQPGKIAPTIGNGLFGLYFDPAAFDKFSNSKDTIYFNLIFEMMSDGWTYWTDTMKVIVSPFVGIYENIINSFTFNLYQNYPNPFNPITKIKYSIPNQSSVTIKVYDILGREIETLINKEEKAGNYEINWNASKLSSGVYFYQLKAGEFIQTKKMLLLK